MDNSSGYNELYEDWCIECENQAISFAPDNKGRCDYCIWKHYYKLERYDIYNDFWREHFIEMGRIIECRRDIHEPYKTACSFIRPDAGTIEIKNKKSETKNYRILTPLGPNKKIVIIPEHKPIVNHDGPWSSLFETSNVKTSPIP